MLFWETLEEKLVCSQYAHMLWNVRILASQVEDMYIVFCALQLSQQCYNAKLPTSPKFANTRGLNVLHCVAHSSAWHVCRWFDMLECAKQNVGAWFMWLDCLPWFDVPQHDAAELLVGKRCKVMQGFWKTMNDKGTDYFDQTHSAEKSCRALQPQAQQLFAF